MMWAIAYQPTISEWLLHPAMFATREAARYAADNWPDLLKYNHKRVVQIACETQNHNRLAKLMPLRGRPVTFSPVNESAYEPRQRPADDADLVTIQAATVGKPDEIIPPPPPWLNEEGAANHA